MSLIHFFIVLPVRMYIAFIKALFHSLFKLRWTPSSRSWLMRIDGHIRSKITHKNTGEWVPVMLGNDKHNIWTVTVEGDVRDTTPLVMVHGMGGGCNMFLNNIDAFAQHRDVILLDLPGFGLSSRPELRIKYVDGWWVDTDEDDVEEFYTEVLEAWFQKMGLHRVVVLGHSYGAYISSVYCLKYHERVKHLILADPWGFPQRPANAEIRPFMRNRPLFLLSKLYSKMYIFTPIRLMGPLALPLYRTFKLGLMEKFVARMHDLPQDMTNSKVCQRLLREDDYSFCPDFAIQDYCYLWMMHSPFVFRTLRADLGRKYDEFFTDHTFSDYFYACNTCDRPSGEIGFFRVTIPFGWAKKPLVERVHAWDPSLDVTFIYGARSWVSCQPGFEIRHQRHGNYVDVHVISGAGHHVYADRPQAFNNMVIMICDAVDKGTRPNISSEFEQRITAMSSLRRRESCLSQAELCNDEAGIHQRRSASAHEFFQARNMSDLNVGGECEECTEHGAVGGVKFGLDSVQGEEDYQPPVSTVTFNLGGDTLSIRKKSTLKSSKPGIVKNVSFASDALATHFGEAEMKEEGVEEDETNSVRQRQRSDIAEAENGDKPNENT